MTGAGELLLLLADGRWPGGGYAHSGGLEAAVSAGLVHDVASLDEFVTGRLHAAGPFEGWIAAQACVGADLSALSTRYDARTPAPALRRSSTMLGRGLVRSSARVWPGLRHGDNAEHFAIAVGVVARHAGLSGLDAARLAVHGLVMTTLSAAPKLFAIDTADALSIAVRLAPAIDAIATGSLSAEPPPARASLMHEQLAEDHAAWSTRLFAS